MNEQPVAAIENSPFTNADYREALLKSMYFYYAQRSGKLPEHNPVTWRGDSALDDGQDVGRDLSGGFYDAGDHVKFGLPGAYTATMLAWGYLSFPAGYEDTGAAAPLLDHLMAFADYYTRAYDDKGTPAVSDDVFYAQVGNGDIDHDVWDAPERMTMERPTYSVSADKPGSDVTGETASALAAIGLALKTAAARMADDGTADAAMQEELVQMSSYSESLISKAVSLHEFADTYRGKYSDVIPDAAKFYGSKGYEDEIAWSAAWLYAATGDENYLNKADQLLKPDGGWIYFENKGGHTTTLLYQLTGNDKYGSYMSNYTRPWMDGSISRTPGTATNPGMSWYAGFGSSGLAGDMSFVSMIYAKKLAEQGNTEEAKSIFDFSVDQIDYVLGDNPQKMSYMIGFGDKYPLRTHHRAASGVTGSDVLNDSIPNRNILYGGIAGGPALDGSHRDSRGEVAQNEVSLVWNSGMSGALAAIYSYTSGKYLDQAVGNLSETMAGFAVELGKASIGNTPGNTSASESIFPSLA